MIHHVAIVVLMALVAYGAHIVQQEGMILERLGKLWSFLPAFWQKPLWTCPPCMCGAWGVPAALIVAPDLWPYLPIYLFASAGLSAYLNR